MYHRPLVVSRCRMSLLSTATSAESPGSARVHVPCCVGRSEELVAGRGTCWKQIPCKSIRGLTGRFVAFEPGQRGN